MATTELERERPAGNGPDLGWERDSIDQAGRQPALECQRGRGLKGEGASGPKLQPQAAAAQTGTVRRFSDGLRQLLG